MLTVVGGIFLPIDEGFGVKQRAVSTGSDLVDDTWFKINVEGTRYMLAAPRLGEEGRKTVVVG
jgi:hypothetical protein